MYENVKNSKIKILSIILALVLFRRNELVEFIVATSANAHSDPIQRILLIACICWAYK